MTVPKTGIGMADTIYRLWYTPQSGAQEKKIPVLNTTNDTECKGTHVCITYK